MRGHDRESRRSGASEDEIAEALAQVRVQEERWDEYRRAMREHTSRFEEAAAALGPMNYFVQKGLAARRELDSYVGQLAYQQTELVNEAQRKITSSSEVGA